jgi:predicted nucleic acid-binding protein
MTKTAKLFTTGGSQAWPPASAVVQARDAHRRFDEMIAAHALALDAVLVTDNLRHFRMVDGLVIENWIRGN